MRTLAQKMVLKVCRAQFLGQERAREREEVGAGRSLLAGDVHGPTAREKGASCWTAVCHSPETAWVHVAQRAAAL